MGYIAGHHSAYFSLLSLSSGGPTYVGIGSTENGYTERNTHHTEPVKDDAFGQAMPDAVNMGQDTTVSGVSVEFDKSKGVLYQSTPKGQINTNVGKLQRGFAGTLVLTPKPGTPAETELGVGMSRIYYLAIVENDVETIMAAGLRKSPINFRCYPDPNNSDTVSAIIATPGGVSGNTP